MKFFYFFIPVLVIGLSTSSCIFFEDVNANTGGKDTIIAVSGIEHIEVQQVDDDSSTITTYWTDLDGRPLYKKSILNLVKGVKDGQEKRWARNGELVYNGLWANGELKALSEYYANASHQLKHRIEYDPKGGYPAREYNYYADGSIRTDTIQYSGGKKNGSINYYDEERGKVIESHVYADDELIKIQIYRSDYDILAARAEALKASQKRDSVRRIRRDSIFDALIGEVNKADSGYGGGSDWSNNNNALENIRYLEGLLKDKDAKKKEDKNPNSAEAAE